MIKKILLILAMIPAFIVMLITAVAKRLTSEFDSDSIGFLVGYLTEFQGASGLKELTDSDAGVLFFLHEISTYSHWIITVCVIWLIIIHFSSI